MKNSRKYILTLIMAITVVSCKKELNVQNPNQPTVDNASTESGIISLAIGGVYVNGFKTLQFGDGVYGQFWSGAMGFHEMMGDVIGAEAANGYINQIGCPDYLILDDGTKVVNPNAPAK